MQLFFDLDGTLTDPRVGITRCLAHALRELGLSVPEPVELERFIGPPLTSTFAALLESDETALIERAIGLYRERFGDVGLFENEPYPGVHQTLEGLGAAGHRCRVVTSKPTVYARRIAARFGLDLHLEAVHGSELSGERSEKGELLAHVLDSTGLRGEDCVMIGDRSYDVLGAKPHGLRTVGVLWGFGSREELTVAGADALAGDFDELCRELSRIEEEAA